MASARTRKQAAAILRRFLDAVERGDVNADLAQDRAMLRRIEGALAALEADAQTTNKRARKS